MAGLLAWHFPIAIPEIVQNVLVARFVQKADQPTTTYRVMTGRCEDTAMRWGHGLKNRRFVEAVLFPCRPYSYPDDDSIDRGFTMFLGEG